MKHIIKFSLLFIFSITIMCCGGDNKKEAREKSLVFVKKFVDILDRIR